MAYCRLLSCAEYGQYADKLMILHGKPDNLINLDPFQMPDEDWIDDISQWPPVEFGQDSLQEKKLRHTRVWKHSIITLGMHGHNY